MCMKFKVHEAGGQENQVLEKGFPTIDCPDQVCFSENNQRAIALGPNSAYRSSSALEPL